MKPLNILLIEDNEADAFYLKEILSSSEREIKIDRKNSLEAGIEAINDKDKNIDVVITDLSLPESKGLETFKTLMENSPEDLPILILTGLNDKELALNAVSMGAQDYIIKDNLNPDIVQKSISYSISRKKGNSTIQKQKEEIEEAYKKLQDQQMQLIQTEKMSSIGTMVAGIAHELNNPMMGIINCVQFCMDSHAQDSREYEYLKLAEEATNRCIGIVKNLLTFAHKEHEDGFTEENLQNLLEQVIMLMDYRINSQGINIVRNIPEYIPNIYVRSNNIKQVFLNLITNSIDSMEESGEKELIITFERCEENIKISIEDSGEGIPEELINKIFDPFFSTKPVGKGTGLGLSICNNIIRDHSGELSIRNRPDGGVISEIILPARSKSFEKIKEVV